MGLGLASAVVGCADDSSKTDLLGTPDILQVMVLVDGADADVTFTDPLSGYAITYEQTLPFGGNILATSDYAACYLFNTGTADDPNSDDQGVPTTLCQQPNLVGMCVCPDFADADVTCQQTGALIGRCVDSATSLIPVVRHAQAEDASIRVVVGDLLDGPTLEHFACACQGSQLDSLDPANCTSGEKWANPDNCNICGTSDTDPTTAGRCLDTDSNGLPDFSSLIPGLYTLTCTLPAGGVCPTDLDGWATVGAACVYTSGEGGGFFYPSGNQFQSSVTGLGGVGPAVVLSPGTALPTGATCTIALSDAIKDQKGNSLRLNAIHDGGTPTFTVQDLTVDLALPAATINITNSTALRVEVDAIAPITAATLTADVTDLNSTAADPTQHGVNATPVIDGDTITATFSDVNLVVNHTFTVTITGTATNEFGTSVDFTADEDALSVNTTARVTGAAKK